MDDFGPTTESSDSSPLLGLEHAIEIGRGGYGTVYRAHDPALGRDVALKVLTERLDIADAARFAREGQAMGRLSGHPNVMPVYSTGVTPDRRVFLVMPFAERGSLADRLRQGLIPWPEALTIAIRLAGALQAAHGAGILHRDVKPANVLLSDYGEPWLSDFGIARVEGAYETTRPGLAASLVYAAPEILNGGAPTRAADIYSLGATIFHMLAGRPAFVAPDAEGSDGGLMGLYLRIAREPAPDLRAYGVPDDVSAVVEAAMAKDPWARPRSARDLGQLLQAAQEAHGIAPTAMFAMSASTEGQEPIEDFPEPKSAVRRRNRGGLLKAGAIALVLLVGSAVALTVVHDESGRPVSVIDATPSSGPVPLSASFATTVRAVPAGSELTVNVAGRAGQRALVRVHLSRAPSQPAVLAVIDGGGGVLDATTTNGTDAVLGPVPLDRTSSYLVRVGPLSTPAVAAVSFEAAPDDVRVTDTIGGPGIAVTLEQPRQAELVTYVGSAGQRVRMVWSLPGVPIEADLVLFGPDGKQLAAMSPSGSAISDPITLPASGSYVVRITFGGDLAAKGAGFHIVAE